MRFSLTWSLLLVLRPVTHYKPTSYFYGYRTTLHPIYPWCCPLSSPSHPWRCWKCSQTRSFQCAWRQGYGGEHWSSNKEARKRYFALLNYRSNQNQGTSAYLIGDQRQCHCIILQHHAILHQKDAGVQHFFQLYQQRNIFCSFCTYDYVVRNDDDSKKRSFTSVS